MSFTIHMTLLFALVGLGPAVTPPSQAGSSSQAAQTPQELQENYTVSRQDVLSITVIDQPELTGKYTVESDGAFRFPLIGRVTVAGKTLRQIEADLRRQLSPDYLKNPQIAVSLDQFKGRKIFIFGAVGSPGTYPLGDGMTLIEAMVKAGYGTASEAVIMRSRDGKPSTQTDSQDNMEKLTVNLRELERDAENGQMRRNIALQDGDTIFIPRNDKNRIFVTGQVKLPAAYSVPEGTTVLQAITMAGGVTEAAAMNRISIIRIVKGQNKTIKAKVDDIVKPGDTIVVPERRF